MIASKMNRSVCLAAGSLALAIGLGASVPVFGATMTDNFTTNPGWDGVRNIITDNGSSSSNFGFNPTANNTGLTAPPSPGVATGPGEAGGILSKRSQLNGQSGYYGADLGGFLNLSAPFRATGVLALPNWGDLALLGFFDHLPRRIESTNTTFQNKTTSRPRFIGVTMDATSSNGGFTVLADLGNVSESAGAADSRLIHTTAYNIAQGTRTITVDPADPFPSGVVTPYQFTFDYVPDNTANTGAFTITMTDPTAGTRTDNAGGGGGTFVMNISSAQRTTLVDVGFDRFGISTGGGGASGGASSTQSLFIDDVTYTLAAPVPEPASLAFLGVAAGGLLLRRRRTAK